MSTCTRENHGLNIQPDQEMVKNHFGQSLVVKKGDFIGERIKAMGIFDVGGTETIKKILEKLQDPICLDIGANIGNHALVTAQFCKHLYLFECQKDIAEILENNLKLNNISNYSLFNFGLADKNGETHFYPNTNNNTGASSFCGNWENVSQDHITLPIRRGDDVIKENNITKIDFIKLDVEGFEAEVLTGLKETFQAHKPIILMEWDSRITRKKFLDKDIFNNILNGYSIKAVVSNHHKQVWKEKFLGSIRKNIHRKLNKKKWFIGEFHPESSYGNIIIYPNSKTELIDSLSN